MIQINQAWLLITSLCILHFYYTLWGKGSLVGPLHSFARELGIKLKRVKSILDVVGKKRKEQEKEKSPILSSIFKKQIVPLWEVCLLIVNMCHAFVVGERSWMVCLTQWERQSAVAKGANAPSVVGLWTRSTTHGKMGGRGWSHGSCSHGGYSHLEKPLFFTGQICQKENLKIKIKNMKWPMRVSIAKSNKEKRRQNCQISIFGFSK